ncbi:hypothetical protein VTK73DRAFT_5875 [Phialemonium thermophilum]|uniref:Negative regulator of differentiation 1 n=1 Tax=Phialemonium thermophilum TaxID=223376 RepID=A0ABR3XWT8_9PEZI
MASSTITVDRGDLEALVQRASLNTYRFPVGNVSVSKDELENLRLIAQKYEHLTRNLIRGGVSEDVIDLLSQDDSTIQGSRANPVYDENSGAPVSNPAGSSGFAPQSVRPPTISSLGGYNNSSRVSHTHEKSWATHSPEIDDVLSDDVPADGHVGAAYTEPEQQGRRPQYDRQCTRTVQLLNLPEGTTHGDITSVVRGGALLDIFLRSNDRSATVSFLGAAEAKNFFNHARRHDLYIKNKRVEVKWAERQFVLLGHVANKIGNGATRNLVVRNVDYRHTEESIRDDLDHIHNLVVIKVNFMGTDCHIETNSVHNALFAKMCMMSRAKYKSTKIEWGADECAVPFEKTPQPKLGKEIPPVKKGPNPKANRFHLLNLEDDEEEDVPNGFQSTDSVGITA